MQIILSKKGLDSSFASKAIPILDNKLVFVPIPDKTDKIKYCDLNNGNLLKFINTAGNMKLSGKEHCHLDPQLENYFACDNFKGSFGQIKGFQTHLENEEVKADDLFLFYGWYKDENDKTHTNGKHVIFGYLQIGEIIKPAELDQKEIKALEQKYPWLKNQPHWNKEKYKDIPNNAIYIAKDTCSFDSSLKGFGMFNYAPDLDLSSKELKNRTCWQVAELSGCHTSHKSRYGKDNFDEFGQYKASARCQEIVIDDKKAEKWAIKLIKKHAKNL